MSHEVTHPVGSGIELISCCSSVIPLHIACVSRLAMCLAGFRCAGFIVSLLGSSFGITGTVVVS